MRYYLDTEFNGFGGDLLSLALVREDGESCYLVVEQSLRTYEPWVEENVVPILWSIPSPLPGFASAVSASKLGAHIALFLEGDSDPVIVTDWPDDVRHFCAAVITGPGKMAKIPALKFEVHRVDAYPTRLQGAVQHNAWWDAMALREFFRG